MYIFIDRGYIDNVIWPFIMRSCDNSQSAQFIRNMTMFLNSNFNEPSIAQYIQQKGVIFIDPYAELNRARQMNRCEDGDALRARIFMYPIAQFMMYYTMARLFGWKIVCVPYTNDCKFDNEKYEENIEMISNYFGKTPQKNNVITNDLCRKFLKPSGAYTINNTFAKSIGIFK